MNKLDNIENEIINILMKKNDTCNFNTTNINFFKNITKKQLKDNVNFKVFYLNKIIDKYLVIDNNIMMCDIDIINLIIKYIQINNKLPRKINKSIQKTYLDTLYYYLGYENINKENDLTEYKKSIDYFLNKKDKINILIRAKYFRIFNDIVIKYSG